MSNISHIYRKLLFWMKPLLVMHHHDVHEKLDQIIIRLEQLEEKIKE